MSGLIAVALVPDWSWALCCLLSVGTPRAGAGGSGEWRSVVVLGVLVARCFIVLKKLMSCSRLVASIVLANVSVGGLQRRVVASSMVVRKRSMLLRRGNGCFGNHINW